MVKEQLLRRGIDNERVLAAMGSVPRHLFVDEAFYPRAYGDHPLPIGHEQTISQPYIVALMSQELDPPEGAKILEIGTGSGYQAAVLSVMGCQVYTIERVQELSDRAEKIMKRLSISSVHLRVGDGSTGWRDEAPFDGIIVTAGAPDLPNQLLDQLAVPGTMIIPVGDRISQRLKKITTSAGTVEKADIVPCTFVPLIGEQGWSEQ